MRGLGRSPSFNIRAGGRDNKESYRPDSKDGHPTQMFLGIDLTSSEKKPTACALLNADASLAHVGFERTDDDILKLVARHRPQLAAIDGPLGFPRGMDCLDQDHACESEWEFKGRLADRQVIERGISIYVITKRTFIKAMVYRAIELVAGLRKQGCEVIEVYPYASKVRLFGKPIPKKTTRPGREFLRERLGALIPGLDGYTGRLDHDLYDALTAAYTGYLHSVGRTEALGVEEEGRIILPVSA